MSVLSKMLGISINVLHPTPGNKLEEDAHSILSAIAQTGEGATAENQFMEIIENALASLATKAVGAGVPATTIIPLVESAATQAQTEATNALNDLGASPP